MGKAARPKRIVRATKGHPYFTMCRETAQNKELSWAARGVLAYLLSKPDDWEIQVTDLQQGCGRDKVYAILKELDDAHYLSREQIHDAKGKIQGWEYHVHELPFTENPDMDSPQPFPEKPDTAKPDTANPLLHIKEEELQNTDRTDSPKPPMGVESRSSNGEFDISEIQIDASTIDPGRALQPFPPVPPPPSPFDLETELMLVAIRRVTGLDYRLIPQVLEDVQKYLKCGYTAEDIANAQQVCMKSDWKWTDPKQGNSSRIMDLADVKKYIGAPKTRTNVFKYDPEMQLDALISRVREAGDIRAIDAGWQPALPAEV
jgi:hypothetical protein